MRATFRPAEVRLAERAPGLTETARRLKENPLSALPRSLLTETYQKSESMGAVVHRLSGPDEIAAVLRDDPEAWRKSPLILRTLRPVLGDAVFTAHGARWRSQRLRLQPAFMRKRIEAFAPMMDACARDLAGRLAASAPGVVDVEGALNDAAFQVIEHALFSEAREVERAQMRQALETLLGEIGVVRLVDLAPFPEWVPRPMSRAARRARAVFRRCAQAQIRRRRERADPGSDLMGLLLKSEGEAALSDEDVRDTLITLIAAGHETTAIALTWALYLLANDATAQRRARAEARAAIAEAGEGALQPGALGFIRQVLEEAMRLYPPAPALGRRAVRDTEIAGRKVRRGERALLVFYCLHRHETLWDAPGRFDPDRFSPERRPRDPFMHAPFGGGPRTCIGAHFALTEASLMLARALDAVSLSPVDGHEVEPLMQVTVRPRGGLPLRIEHAP